MSERQFVTVDGNEAATHVAHQVSEVIAIYPITPASPMGELADAWSSVGRTNIWAVPDIMEMQSEGGASAAVHGAIQAGALTTTFTASQGLLLMIPTLFKVAGELTPTVLHVSARTLATHALSIFGDHSDVMSVRSTGWAMLVSNSVQEVQDMAMIAHAATLKCRVPFLHFFDGFRTSHEVNKIEQLTTEDIRSMIDDDLVLAHRLRAMNPDRPVLRGTAQNPDVFFQAREAANPFYDAVPGIVQETMDRFAKLVGRQYHLCDYYGDPAATRVIVIMGSGVGAVEEAAAQLNQRGEKVGVVKVRLFRPFLTEAFLAALPQTTRNIAVLDRTKEPGAIGEPLYQDVVTALMDGWQAAGGAAYPRVIGGRYGLSSKEFTPAMATRVFEELGKPEPQFSYQEQRPKGVANITSRWVSQIAYIDNTASVELIFSPAIIPLITRLEKHFTSYEMKQISYLSTGYAVRLYEILIAWRSTGKTPVIELIDFRKQIGVLDTEYNRMHDFKKRVLDPSIKQIKEHTDITVEVEQHKKGRSITGFSFRLQQKKSVNQELINTINLDTVDLCFKMTDAQRHMFANKLSELPSMGKYSQGTESFQQFAIRIAEMLQDPERFKELYPYLKKVGYR